MSRFDAYSMELSGTQLVEASAGTGKTYTIATLYLRLVLERSWSVTKILVVTFTRAATAELRDRIRARLQEALAYLDGRECEGHDHLRAYFESRSKLRAQDVSALQLALSEFDEASVFTIHSFCQRALSDAALESSAFFDIDFVEDEGPLIRELVEDYWASLTYEASPTDLQALRQEKLNLDRLYALANSLRNASGQVLPESVAKPNPFSLGAWEDIRNKVIEIWRRHREEVETLLRGPALNKRSYNLDTHVPQLCSMLDHLAHETPATVGDKLLQKLCPDELRSKTKKGEAAPHHALFDACNELALAQNGFHEYRQQLVLFVKREFADYLARGRTRRKEELSVQSFDDLLNRLESALRGPSGPSLLERLRGLYRAALIDEFQDTDPLQYELFSRIFANSLLLLIGDPKQAIYGFRGADIYAYLQAAHEAKEHRHTLDTNFRSDPGLVAAVNQLFQQQPAPFLVDDIGYHAVHAVEREGQHSRWDKTANAPLQFLYVTDRQLPESPEHHDLTTHVAEAVATEVIDLVHSVHAVGEREIHYGDVAVLCRTNTQVIAIHRAMGNRGVPSVIDTDKSVFDSSAAEDLQRLLCALANPEDATRVRAALTTTLLGVTLSEILAMEQDDSAWEQWASSFVRWHALWNAEGFIAAFQRLMVETHMIGRLLARADGERWLTDVQLMAELLHEISRIQSLGPISLWLRFVELRGKRGAQQMGSEATQLRLESDMRAVRITTIHKAKGLEYPVVFCPFLWTNTGGAKREEDLISFHDENDHLQLKHALAGTESEQQAAWARKEQHAEAMRTLYVALTRAKHLCYVIWATPKQSAVFMPLWYLLFGIRDAKAYKGEDDSAALLENLRAICEASQGSLSMRPLTQAFDRVYTETHPQINLNARTLKSTVKREFALQSFSGLLAQGDHLAAIDEAEDADHDQVIVVPTLGTPVAVNKVTMADLPRSAAMGSLIHQVYEHLDFQAANKEAVQRAVSDAVRAFGEAEACIPSLVQGVLEALTTPLDKSGMRLRDISLVDRISELEFTLAVGSTNDVINTERFSQLFTMSESPIASGYGHALGNLSPTKFYGFLRGFVDLVFRHNGRYYIVDYKSNWLGLNSNDYERDRLSREMVRHHYILQYYLYSAALDRYLRFRVRDYDSRKHFGGVYYLFLRGMSPSHPLGTGVFFDQPDATLVNRILQLFGEGNEHDRG